MHTTSSGLKRAFLASWELKMTPSLLAFRPFSNPFFPTLGTAFSMLKVHVPKSRPYMRVF